MTVSSSLSTQTFSCNGSTTVFTCPFRVLESSEVRGYLITISTGASVELTNGSDFVVTGVGAANAVATTAVAYSSLYQLNFRRRTQRLQSTDYRTNDPFPAESHEIALDRLTHIAQEHDADIGRALLAPEPETGITLPPASERALKFLAFDSAGGPIPAAVGDGTAASLAAYIARGLAIDGSDNVVATQRVQSPRFEGTNTDDSGTPDAVFRAARALSSGVLDGHGFRDQTTFSRAANSYAAFDAAITSGGNGTNDHIAGFQSRPVVSRSGGSLTHVYNFTSAPTFNTGSATNNYGVFCFNPTGAGTVDYNYGVYVPNQTKGSISNHAIYVAQGGHLVFFGADTQINQLLRVGTAQLILGGASTSDYPFLGYNYEPTTGKYQATDVAVTAKLDTTGFRFYGAASGTGGTACTLTELLQVKLTGAARFMPKASAPSPAAAGDVYYDSGTNKLRCYNGATWNDLF